MAREKMKQLQNATGIGLAGQVEDLVHCPAMALYQNVSRQFFLPLASPPPPPCAWATEVPRTLRQNSSVGCEGGGASGTGIPEG